jgi:methylmalonyl-CoA mutase, N-terminal domain
VRDRFGSREPRSQMLRFHAQTGGSTLTAQQPENNVVRVALQAFSAVAGGCQSLHTNGFDEALALPTERSATLALRTQQILAYETGVAKVADPLGGSYYVEALTDEFEARVVEIMDDLERRGGMVHAIEEGYLQGLIADEAFRVQRALSSGERPVVGVNLFPTDDAPPDVEGYELDEAGRARQLERLAEVKRSRSSRDVREKLDALGTAAAKDDVNLMPLLVDAAKAYCTLGEMVDVLKDQWGEFQQPAVF